jgi:hypothetical protein
VTSLIIGTEPPLLDARNAPTRTRRAQRAIGRYLGQFLPPVNGPQRVPSGRSDLARGACVVRELNLHADRTLFIRARSLAILAADVARACGAGRVRCVDRDPARLELAESLGIETGTLAEFNPDERE